MSICKEKSGMLWCRVGAGLAIWLCCMGVGRAGGEAAVGRVADAAGHADALVGTPPAMAPAASPEASAPDAHLSLAQGLALAKQRRCLGCHQVDSPRVGPPFSAVAQRFHGQPEAAQYLARVIRSGSSGQWGAIPMPAQTRVPPEDALRLARWILSLADRPVDHE